MQLLAQAKAIAPRDTYRAGVIMKYVETSPVLEYLDFSNIQGSALQYNLMGKLPGVSFRGVNGSWTRTVGIVNPQWESLKIAGGEYGIDPFIAETQGEAVASAQEAMHLEAQARYVNTMVFDGDEEAEPRQFDGLNKRLTGTQLILAGAGGAPLTQDMVDDLLAVVPGANAIYTGRGGKQLLTKLLRNDSQVETGADAFGNPIMTYAGVPVRDVGDDINDYPIIAFDEDPGDATADTTSIYAVRHGDANARKDFFGIQSPSGIHVRALGESTKDPANVYRLEWYMSIATASSNCAARLYGIENAIA